MHKGAEFSKKKKVLIFKVIKFCDKEKSGEITIPVSNSNERVITMLGISEPSVTKLRYELHELERQKQEAQSLQQSKQVANEKDEIKSERHLRSRTKSDTASKHCQSSPSLAPAKRSHKRQRGHTGASTTSTQKIHPTTDRLLSELMKLDGFPIRSRATLWREMQKASSLNRPIKPSVWVCDGEGSDVRIAMVLENAPWHSCPTPETVAPKRAWRKGDIQEWLHVHKIVFRPHSGYPGGN
ncbi:unnamed protein product [Didymodactylos carnosus]|uniref:Uncharacterized protein n=1 Tax=Didymodactylos carnosus TaxID=1234261 RepID=A0A815N1I2_9BILA|nr:unnamed protein product [Didymodactylos carnosus]CAF4308236.1 unnamed protein product [Didymodactylos carnosus]